MSLIKANAVQVGQSPTATQNFTLAVPSSPNGTIKLARGNAGATTQDVISVSNSGVVSFPQGLGNISNSTAISTGSTTARSLANRFADVINVKDFGAVGDGVADDTEAIQDAINSLTDNSEIIFPNGIYKIIATNSNVTPTGDTLYHSVVLIENKNNILISGNGKLMFYSDSSTTLNFLFTAKNCTNIHFDSLTIEGDLNLQENVPNSEIGVGSGIYLYNSTACSIVNSNLKKLIKPIQVSGQAKSPATTSSVSKQIIISNNNIEYFEQNTTFGAGASDLIINGNTFKNGYCCTKISQNPLNDPASIGAAGRVILSNNTCTWSNDFEFAEVWFDLGKSQVPYGFQIQAHNQNIIINNNIIDMSKCRALTLPPLTDPAGVMVFTSDATVSQLDQFQPTRLAITDNIIICHPTQSQIAIRSTPFYRNVEISNNYCIGAIQIQGTGGNPLLKYGLHEIFANTVMHSGTQRAAQISVTAGYFNELHISANTLLGDPGVLVLGDQETLFLTGFTSDSVTIANNVLRKGKVGNYTSPAFTCVNFDILGNVFRGVDISTNNVTRGNIVGNSAITNGTAYKINLDSTTKSNSKIKIVGNSCVGETNANSSTAVNINGGELRIDGNSFDSNAGSAFVFDSTVFIRSGEYYGSGVPAQSALFGTRYIDYNVTSNAVYMKTTSTGSAGWGKIQTAP